MSDVWTGDLKVVWYVCRGLFFSFTVIEIRRARRNCIVRGFAAVLVFSGFNPDGIGLVQSGLVRRRGNGYWVKKSRPIFPVRRFAPKIQHFLQLQVRSGSPSEWSTAQRLGIRKLAIYEFNRCRGCQRSRGADHLAANPTDYLRSFVHVQTSQKANA
jgi:hypothetical protein